MKQEKYLRSKLSKILAFINYQKHLRYAEGCTIIPIPTTKKELIAIFGNQPSVSKAIDDMKEIGLISTETIRFTPGRRKQPGIAKTYRYYYDNEQKLIEYCRELEIEPYQVDRDNLYIEVSDSGIERREMYSLVYKNSQSITPVTLEDSVKISNHLFIPRPVHFSKKGFEEFLVHCLLKKYPSYDFYAQEVLEINKHYKDERFKLHFKFNFTWNDEETAVTGIGIRATNSYCNLKREERAKLNEKYRFSLENDVISSVPRVTMSLNQQKWFSDNVDIYKLIYDQLGDDKPYTPECREAIKSFHMRCYFDGTDKQTAYHIWYAMDQEGLTEEDKDDCYNLIYMLRAAIREVEGKLYGSEIFYVESCVYLKTLHDLIKKGYKTWQVYDCFYTKDDKGVSEPELQKEINKLLEKNFKQFISKEPQFQQQ